MVKKKEAETKQRKVYQREDNEFLKKDKEKPKKNTINLLVVVPINTLMLMRLCAEYNKVRWKG